MFIMINASKLQSHESGDHMNPDISKYAFFSTVFRTTIRISNIRKE